MLDVQAALLAGWSGRSCRARGGGIFGPRKRAGEQETIIVRKQEAGLGHRRQLLLRMGRPGERRDGGGADRRAPFATAWQMVRDDFAVSLLWHGAVGEPFAIAREDGGFDGAPGINIIPSQGTGGGFTL